MNRTRTRLEVAILDLEIQAKNLKYSIENWNHDKLQMNWNQGLYDKTTQSIIETKQCLRLLNSEVAELEKTINHVKGDD